MRSLLITLFAIALAAAATAEAPEADAVDPSTLPERVVNFRLIDANGASHDLYRYRDAKGIVLYYQGNGCPIVRQSFAELKRLRDAYREQGILFFMVNANPQDSRKEVLEELSEYEMDIPVLMDERQGVTRMLGVTRTAEAILIDPSRWRIVYRGAVDDRFDYGTRKPSAENEYLKNAIDSFLQGKDPEPAFTETKGCLINVTAVPDKVSYIRDVAPILEAKCVSCHAPGQIGPFAFGAHKDVDGWARMIEEVVLTQRMPPWNADPHVGARFSNDWSLTEQEEKILLAYLRDGAPKETGDDPLVAAVTAAAVPKSDESAPAWKLGEPDMVLALPEAVTIPAEGTMPYHYTTVQPELETDVWVTAAEVIPTDRSVTHHALIFVIYPEQYLHLQHDVQAGLDGYFAAYVPGQGAGQFPEGTGKFLPKGSTLVFQMHYTPNGKQAVDQTRMGLHFQKTPPAKILETRAAYNTDFRIPANTEEHVTRASFAIDEDIVLHGMSPHMHYRGKWFSYEAHLPDGDVVPLLSVPRFDFDWQMLYRLALPIHLPAGTRIVCIGAHDNSARNPANPDPNRRVRFGEQTYDEMFIGYLEYTKVNQRAEDWLKAK